MVGIPLSKLVFSDSSTHIQAKSLLIPFPTGTTGNPPSWVCTFLREKFLKHKANIDSPTRLYISRSKAKYKIITNEENVIQCLLKFEFTPVWLEEHNFATQIALLSNAEVVVAFHGTGLTNLIWFEPGLRY